MNQKEMNKMQDELSNAIWDVIKKKTDACKTFHWEVAFKNENGETIEFEEGDIEE